jgi:hypothetical protein
MSRNQQTFIEKRIVSNENIPDRLFACFARASPETSAALSPIYETGKSIPDTLAKLHTGVIPVTVTITSELIWQITCERINFLNSEVMVTVTGIMWRIRSRGFKFSGQPGKHFQQRS